MQQAKKRVPKSDGGRNTAARRLWETAGDELVRWAVKASATGAVAWVTYWIDHH